MMGKMATVVCMVTASVLAGCGAKTTSRHVELKQGEFLESHRLVRIAADGKAEFHNSGAGDFTVGVGESFALERQSRHLTIYEFTVERTDPAKQEATVLVKETTKSRGGRNAVAVNGGVGALSLVRGSNACGLSTLAGVDAALYGRE